MNKFLLLIFSTIAFSTLRAGNMKDYKNHIATDRLIVIFDKNTSVAEQDRIIKSSGLISDFTHLPNPNLTICLTTNSEAAQNYFRSAAGVTFVSFFITDGNGHYGGVLNDFFVKLTDKSFEPLLQATLKADNLGSAIPDTYIPNLYKVVNTRYQTNNTVDWCILLQKENWVQYASPNYLLNPMVNSNDTYYNREWQIHNTGSALQGNGTPGADMKVDTAWALTTGDSTIKIGLIDSGTDTTHTDLKANLLPGHDAARDSGQANTYGYPTPNYPEDGHGTCTAGILAAIKDNNKGVAGVAPSCKVIPVRSFYYEILGGSAQPFSTSAYFAAAYGWACDSGHADILSSSWALPANLIALLGGAQPVEDALNRVFTSARGGKGIAMFFSSGNIDDSSGVLWPGYLASCISVNATNQCDTRKASTDCSGDVWGGDYGPGLAFSAPGENMTTTDMIGAHGFSNGDYCLNFSGTSASCPNAAAVGALVLSMNPQFTANDVRNILARTCDRVGGYAYDSTNSNGTWCRELGYGRLNAYKAVTYALSYTAIETIATETTFKIFPNPSRSLVNVQYMGNETALMKLYDLTGSLVASQELNKGLNTMDVSILSGGIYLARVDTPSGTATGKLVVCR